MADHQADFKTRYSNPIAEPKSEEFYRKRGYTYFRYGIDQGGLVSSKAFIKLPSVIQKTPDYILIDKGQRSYFVEVKGCHKVLRIKVSDLECYKFWDKLVPSMRLFFFIYSTCLKSSKQTSCTTLTKMIDNNNYEIRKYSDNNKQYYAIPVEDIWG